MLAQLGEIVFQNLLSPQSISFEGNENVFADIELINKKNTLQRTGQTATEINISIQFHARFCRPKTQLDLLKKYHNSGEALTLLMGNGENKGDFVIQAYPYTIDETFADGTIIQCTVSLKLKEYVSTNKLAALQSKARVNATAVGTNIKPITRITTQPEAANLQAAKLVTGAKLQAIPIDADIRAYQNNVSSRAVLSAKIQDNCKKANKALDDLENKLDTAEELQNKFTTLNPVISQLKTAYSAINNLLPSADPGDLNSANTYLQSTIRTFSTSSNSLMQDVILRR